jgi:predicted ATPase/DNA-binding XRE family transcriptional regulator
MQDEISFGKWLRKQRRALDLSRQAFANQVGCAEVTLRRIEAGTLKPSKELASIILEKLNIPEAERPQWISFARGLSAFPLSSTPSSNKPITNLPAPLTTFIGREKEQPEVVGLVAKHRLVTLTGSGGVGKTRLSIKVGEQVLENYADGVWLVELASLSNPALIAQTFAAVFGISAQSTIPLTNLLINFLRAKSVLLIVDNCEHLLDACAHLIDTLLKSCPHLKILATSREPLGITGEAIYLVPSLELPSLQQLINTFRDFESVHLFEERAQLIQFDFSLTLENAASVAQICQRLDGIPLAIELAAAKVGVLSTEQIAKQLDESFNVLTGGSRTALPRHQTLRASMNWSWGLLTEAEQTLMRQLSVFAGGWTLEAAQAICDRDVFELSDSLLKKSLIVMHQETGRETRYRFHETIRQYAHEKLVEAGEDESTRKRHRDWFLAWVETVDPIFYVDLAWFNLIESEHDNLRAALVWSQARHEFEICARIAFALTEFWNTRGYIREGRKWLESALDHRESLSKIVLAKTLFTTSRFALRLGDYPTAEAYGKESVALFRELGDNRNLAWALRGLGEVYMWANESERSRPFFAEAMTLFQEVGDKRGICYSLIVLGSDAIMKDEYKHGMALLNEHQTLAYELDDMWEMGVGAVYLGIAEFLQGNVDQSEKLFREGLARVRPYGDVDRYTDCLEGLAATSDRRGQSVRSVRLWGAAQHLFDSTGLIPGKNWVWVPRVREPTIASLRAQLGEATFEAAYAEGYAMRIDEAIKYALKTVEEM